MKTHAMMNQRGQMTIEMILIAIVLTTVAIAVTSYARANHFASELTEGPWDPLRGMIEDGVWAPSGTAASLHPNTFARHATNRTDQTF